MYMDKIIEITFMIIINSLKKFVSSPLQDKEWRTQ